MFLVKMLFKKLLKEKMLKSLPMHGMPSKIAIVAGSAPLSLTIASTSFAVSRFWGYGIPKHNKRNHWVKGP